MRFVLLLLLLGSFSVFGQQFHPDYSGHVSDPAFLKLIKTRNYTLVGAFDSLPSRKPVMAALVLKVNEWVYLDWNGKEYASYDALGNAFGFETGSSEFMQDVDPGERMPEMFEELMPAPGPYGYTGVFRENQRCGFKYHDRIILPAKYDAVEQLHHPEFLFLKVRKEGRYAIYDYQGQPITPFVYEKVEMLDFHTTACMFRVSENHREGVLSQKGKVTIPLEFDKITVHQSGPHNNLLVVKRDTLFGAYNFAGKLIAEPVYSHLEPLWSESPRLALSAARNGRYGILGMSGETTIPFTYRYRLYYGAKQAFITYSDDNHFRKIGALDTLGKPLLPPLFGMIYQPEGGNGLFVMIDSGNNRKFGVYDLTGKMVLDTIYGSYQPFGAVSENGHSEPDKYFVCTCSDGKRNKYGLFDVHTLKWVVPCEYDVYSISGNYLLIGKGNDENRVMGLVNRKGKMVVPLKYQDVDYREDDRIAVVRQNESFGVVDFKGNLLIPFVYKRLTMLPQSTIGRNATLLPKGYFIFSKDSLCGLMKLDGKVIIPAKYNAILPVRSGFICQGEDSCVVVNYKGNHVLGPLPLNATESISGIFSFYRTPQTQRVCDLYGHRIERNEPFVVFDKGYEPVDPLFPPDPVVSSTINDPARIYDTYEVTEPPQFPQGYEAMQKFIAANLKYPQTAMELGIEGKCFLEFIVNADGKLSDIKVLKGVTDCPDCNHEAIRVIKLMPDWIPAQMNGIAVRCRFRIPVRFHLS